jgi:hypothetical protein
MKTYQNQIILVKLVQHLFKEITSRFCMKILIQIILVLIKSQFFNVNVQIK